jgi:hypothetical protein
MAVGAAAGKCGNLTHIVATWPRPRRRSPVTPAAALRRIANRSKRGTVNNLAAARRSSFMQRLVGAATLQPATYEEVEADRGAIVQAITVVVASSVAAGVGARAFDAGRPGDFVFFTGVALLSWAAWALLTFEVGARILPGAQTRADYGQLLRTTGFAATPGILRVLGVVPGLGVAVFAVTAVWMLCCMIVAVRQALDYASTGRAIAVCVIGWGLTLALILAIGLFGPRVS